MQLLRAEYGSLARSCFVYIERTIWEAYENILVLSNRRSLIKLPSEVPRYSRTITSYMPSLPYQRTREVLVLPEIVLYTSCSWLSLEVELPACPTFRATSLSVRISFPKKMLPSMVSKMSRTLSWAYLIHPNQAVFLLCISH